MFLTLLRTIYTVQTAIMTIQYVPDFLHKNCIYNLSEGRKNPFQLFLTTTRLKYGAFHVPEFEGTYPKASKTVLSNFNL